MGAAKRACCHICPKAAYDIRWTPAPRKMHGSPALICATGLDARAAAIVMRTVRNTVDTGRTVVCTIHQPSIDIFEVRSTAERPPAVTAPHHRQPAPACALAAGHVLRSCMIPDFRKCTETPWRRSTAGLRRAAAHQARRAHHLLRRDGALLGQPHQLLRGALPARQGLGVSPAHIRAMWRVGRLWVAAYIFAGAWLLHITPTCASTDTSFCRSSTALSIAGDRVRAQDL